MPASGHDGSRGSLREAGAPTVIRELTNTLSFEREDVATLGDRLSAGEVEPPVTPSPRFVQVAKRLASAGIGAVLDPDEISFGFSEPDSDYVELTRPVEHPWLPGNILSRIADHGESDQFLAARNANDRLSRLLEQEAPGPLTGGAHRQLVDAVHALFDSLLTTADLRFGTRTLLSGRTVLAPGPDLGIDQLGLPEEMAWPLFSPFVSRILGVPETTQRDAKARAALESADGGVLDNPQSGPLRVPQRTAGVPSRPDP